MPAIPPALARNAVGAWADAGRRCLDELPGMIRQVARNRDLTVCEPYPLSYHWVAPATRVS
ncbi:MAG TPA: hypothetical protein VJT31_13520 [Rugosimonospora sp.]|nr:hypothetical protein [Rugosimonospora sp.]